MNNICYLTVDFEDFTHDFKRDILKESNPEINTVAINKSYEFIKFLLNKFDNPKITFFCTGILAKKYPEIISRIANDGHEIACHYFNHDEVFNESIDEFEKNIQLAISYLQKASNQKILGFRAPKFSVSMKNIEHYKIINKYFKYDSSLNLLNKNKISNFKINNDLKNLTFIPVPTFSLLNTIKYKTGGTYFKFFPTIFTRILLKFADKKNFIPLVYIHPYEFENGKNFKIKFKEINLPFFFKFYWYIRQIQWLYFMNYTTTKKLIKIYKNYKIGGMLKECL
jgi:hypothetical protein